MTGAIRIHQFGGPDVIRWEDIDLPPPAPGEITIRQTAVGLNFIDTYHRSGLYPLTLPAGLGTEAAGVVEALGAGVTTFRVGDRVAYSGLPPGAWAERRNWPAERTVALPPDLTDEIAAAAMLKGLTAWYLLRKSYPVQRGDPVLVYAAAGGAGSIVCQWATALGAHVIGVVGSERKAEFARAHGAADTVLSSDPGFVARVRERSGGGVAVVYDSVGKDTFFQSLDCLRRHGMLVSFGNASGPVAPFSPMELAKRGSLYVTRPSLFDFITTRAELLEGTSALFDVLVRGDVRIEIGQRHPLRDAARAQIDLEARRTTGATVLLP